MVFPIVFIFAFAIHPNLFSLAIVTDVNTRIGEFHGNWLMHLGHALMLLTVPLLIVVSLKFMELLPERGAWLGFVGCVMAVFGAVVLAIAKRAERLCVTLDTLRNGVPITVSPQVSRAAPSKSIGEQRVG